MSLMEFEEKAPRPKRAVAPNQSLITIAYAMIQENKVGAWLKVAEYKNRGSALSGASRLRLHPPRAWPAGHWEFDGQEAEDGSCSELFIKYNGSADEVIVDNGGRRRKGFVVPDGPVPLEEQVSVKYGSRVEKVDYNPAVDTLGPDIPVGSATKINFDDFKHSTIDEDGVIKGMNFDELD